MLKLIAAIFIGASIAHGCHDPLKGSLTVDEIFSVRTSKGLTELQPGNYQLTMSVHGDRLVLKLKGSGKHGQKVQLTLDRPPKTPGNQGGLELLAAQSGQPFDLYGQVTSANAGGPTPSNLVWVAPMSPSVATNAPSQSYRPCAPARSYPAVDDGSQQIEVRQYPLVSSNYGMERSMVMASIQDPQTGRILGRLSASLTKEASNYFNNGC